MSRIPGRPYPALVAVGPGLTCFDSKCYAFQMSRPKQLELALPRRGGKRPGAGRKRTRSHPGLIGPGVPHVGRPEFAARCPLHITQRIRPGVGHLRTDSRSRLIQIALHESSHKFGMQVVHFSIQGNHLHLIVEAQGTESLSRGMQGLAIRIARRLNARLRRRGAVFADRYHAHLLNSRREVANAVRYVVRNYRHHARETLPRGFQDPLATSERAPLETPRLWILREGWKLEPPARAAFFEPG
jgi:putative transposase